MGYLILVWVAGRIETKQRLVEFVQVEGVLVVQLVAVVVE
jgi:hypothetical protein